MAVADNPQQHRFEVAQDGATAFLSYRLDDGAIALVHTEVPEALEGKGIGSSLATAAFDYARSKKLRVVVICPFVGRWLERHPENQDLVVKS